MPLTKRIVIVAGEESGDIHAASLVRQLRAENRPYEISGIGGRHMEDAGVSLISDLAQYGITGLTEVFGQLRIIKKAFTAIKTHLSTQKPDLLILVDYPGFNLRLAKFAKEQGIRILYYISPQIWAWKANRIKTIKAYVDRMAVILPFEKKIYQKAEVPVSFVGHPLVEKLPYGLDPVITRKAFNLPLDKQIVALLPGSRKNEILRHMPVLIETARIVAREIKNLHFVIPIATNVDPQLIKKYSTKNLELSFIIGHAPQVVACSDAVVVASGTASLECALLEKPMCIIYKGALLSYVVAMKVMRVKYFGLCNLLENQMIAPELLQYDCNPKELSRTLKDLLTDKEISERMQRRLKQLRASLSTEQKDCSLADLVTSELEISAENKSISG